MLYVVIMNRFTMNDAELKQFKLGGSELERGDDGKLYDRTFRALMGPLDVDTAAIEALTALRMAGRSLMLLQERWAEQHHLSSGRLAVMFRLMRCGDTALGDLAEGIDSTPRNITGLVDHLERDGLVERIPDTEDRRSVRARLTPKGRETIGRIWKEGMANQHVLAGGMSKEDLAQLRHLCLTLVEAARKELGTK
jgi:DNA-binding MarR family transcriptional regulator